MEQQPVRRRRRRRRRTSGKSGIVGFLAYVFGAFKGAYHWAGLLLILAIILALGLGAPLRPLESMFLWWGHW